MIKVKKAADGSKTSKTDVMAAELRVKKDIQNFEERKEKYGEVANASLEFPKPGCVSEFYIKIRPR